LNPLPDFSADSNEAKKRRIGGAGAKRRAANAYLVTI
jgi:hypothetical protein